MGYSVYGKVYDEDCNPIAGVKILPYFKKVDSESDTSRWSTEWYESDAYGYYSYSPEDSNLLTSEGSYKKTKDKFYTVYIYPDEDKDSLTLERASFHEHTLPSADDLELDIVVEATRSPVISAHTFPNAVLTQHDYTMSESSYADTGWISYSCGSDTSQKLAYDNIGIFDGHQLINTIYGWSEIGDREVVNNSNDSYAFVQAGNYILSITAREKWDTETTLTQAVQVKYNEPIMDFSWTPTETNNGLIKGQELIVFHNDTTCLDDRLSEPYRYKWEIEDYNQDASGNNQTVDNALYTDEPTHSFQSEGTREITLTCYWNDGFEDKVVSVTKQISIYPFDIVPKFNWDVISPNNRSQDVTFSPDITTGDVTQIIKYDWVLEDNYPATTATLYTFGVGETSKFAEGSADNTTNVDNTYTIEDTQYPVVKFHSSVTKSHNLVITYYDGWKNVTKEVDNTMDMTTYTLAPEITLDSKSPISYEEEVIITNTTVDSEVLQYDVDWFINDYYAKYNPANPQYGLANELNSKEYLAQVPTNTQTHNFQSKENHVVELTIRFDNGWQRETVDTATTLTPIEYTITPAITSDIPPVDNGFIGKIEVNYSNDSIGDGIARMIEEDWTFNDKLQDSSDVLTIREDQVVNILQPFVWQTPSRKPYSAIDGSTEQNINKDVILSIRYNNGWEDNKYVETTNQYEATPYEVSSEITYQCNVEGHNHGL